MRRVGLATLVGIVVLATGWAGRTADLETTRTIGATGRADFDLGLSRLYRAVGPAVPVVVWQPNGAPRSGNVPQPTGDALVGITPRLVERDYAHDDRPARERRTWWNVSRPAGNGAFMTLN